MNNDPLSVPCAACGAKEGEDCFLWYHFHAERLGVLVKREDEHRRRAQVVAAEQEAGVVDLELRRDRLRR